MTIFSHSPLAFVYEAPSSVINAIRNGIAVEAMNALADELRISKQQLAASLAFDRRIIRRHRPLSVSEGDRVVRASLTYLRAIDVLGDDHAARKWLTRPIRALGGATPLSLLDTGPGYELVSDTLGRLEYGVVA